MQSPNKFRFGFMHDSCSDIGQYLPVIGLVAPSMGCAKENKSKGVVSYCLVLWFRVRPNKSLFDDDTT